jgi:hypothetical protein
MSRSARAFSALVIVVTVAQAVSLVSRGRRGESDFGVFYRTCQLLRAGIGGELYPRLDVVTTWPVSLSPTGLAVFQPFASANPTLASAGWALFNLFLLAISVSALRFILAESADDRLQRIFVPAALLFLILSTGSIQVGQFSVLFAACWILSVRALARGRDLRASAWLAIPAAIKLYPVMMVAIPLSLARTAGRGLRHAALVAAAFVAVSLVAPAIMYGSRAWALNVSFLTNVIFTPAGQVQYMQFPRFGNQSFDSLALRYLTYEPDFHDAFRNIPHFWLARDTVVTGANLLRVVIVLVTLASVWFWRTRPWRTFNRQDLVAMAALWSSTLYLLLPETKARYAVYTLFAFVPLLQDATDRQLPRTSRAWRWVEVVVCVVFVLVLLPVSVQAYGVGFLGALFLWVKNIRRVRRAD